MRPMEIDSKRLLKELREAKEPFERVNITVPKKTINEFRDQCRLDGCSVSEVITKLFVLYLKDRKGKK